MTYAESVALEHIAYRRREGWTWGQIIGEACAVLERMGLPIPDTIGSAAEVERAFASAFSAIQFRKVAAA